MAETASPGNGEAAKKLDERLKSILWYQIGKTVDAETLRLGVNATPQFIGSLTELVWTHIASDLESFARHAKRSTIQTDDVMLLARRNEGLEGILREFVDGLRDEKEEEMRLRQEGQGQEDMGGEGRGGGGGRRRGSGKGKGKGKGRVG